MSRQTTREAPSDMPEDKTDVLAEALRRRSEKDDTPPLPQIDSETENNRRVLAEIILRGAAFHRDRETGWKKALYEEMEDRVPDFSRIDFEEALDLIVSPSYRDFFLFYAEEGPMPDELWEALQERKREADRSTTVPVKNLLDATQEDLTEEEVLEILDTELGEFFELISYDEKTGDVEVRMRPKMRGDVGSALAENLGAPASAELVEVESGTSLEGELPEMDFGAASAYAKQQEATAVLGLLNELQATLVDSPTSEQEKKRDKILQSLSYPVRRRLFGKPSTLEMSQDAPYEQGVAPETIERYADALKQIGAPRPRYYAEQLAKEYPDRTITGSEPHPTLSGQILTLSGEEAPKVTVLDEG